MGTRRQECESPGTGNMNTEITAKGIILRAAPQGEYTRRLVILTDSLGKISAFASGAARASSKLIGLVRPFTAATFTLARGRNAWNLHGVEVIDSFDPLFSDADVVFYAFYILEVAEYFSEEGMPEDEAKELLNLIFVTLQAFSGIGDNDPSRISSNLSAKPEPPISGPAPKLTPALIRRMFELRLLKLEGEYTSEPENESRQDVISLWTHTLSSPLTRLYKIYPGIKDETVGCFIEDVTRLYKKQVYKSFNSEKLIV